MPGLWVPDSAGTYQKGKGLWVSDASGVYQPGKNAWVTDAAGAYQKVWPIGPSISGFSAVKGTPSWQQVKVSWANTAAVKYELRYAGQATVLYSGTGTSYTMNGVPGTSYTFTLRAYDATGAYSDSAPQTVKLDALPAPANFRKTTGTSTTSDWAWNAVTGATGYDLVDSLATGQPTKWSGTGLTVHETGLRASTTYERAVRSKLSTAKSGLSNKVRYTTPAISSSPPGTYTFRAIRANAWAPGRNAWRPSSDGIIHGNGDNWSSFNNGNQGTLFFYDINAIRALFGRVTRIKILIHRDSSAGYSAPQTNHFIAHTMPSYTGGSPMGSLGASADSGSLAWGASGAFDLPVAWGQWIIDGYLNMGGIAWGFVSGRYMRGPALAASGDQGQLSITIG